MRFLLRAGTEVQSPGTEVAGAGTEVQSTGTEVAGAGTEVDSRAKVERPKGPRVAVIDSGVHVDNPHIHGVQGGVGIDDLGRLHADFVDRLGHGTAVTAAILEKAPACEILAVRVFDQSLRTTGRALVGALLWAREQRAQLVNLSLGTTNTAHEAALIEEIEAANAEQTLIVCAAPQAGYRWLPGALVGVIRVDVDMTMPRDCCEIAIDTSGEIRARASGYPRPIPGVPPERNLKGLSFAVANVSGILAATWRLHGAWPAWCQRGR